MAKTVIDPTDGLIANMVGAWAFEKHERLRKYIDASRGVRAKFLPPRGTGGAAYIELFSGPGRSFVEDDETFIDGSPLVAYESAQRSRTKFSQLHFNDLECDNIDALRQRIAKLGGAANYYNEEAEKAVDSIVHALDPAGLHFAFLDPYNLATLPFSIIKKLAALPKMDLLIHVSLYDLQRNLRRYLNDGRVLDAFMPGWRDTVDASTNNQQAIRAALLNHWLGLIRKLDTAPANGIELVGSGGQRLYWLVFVSAHDIGLRLWNDICNVNDQKRLPF